jgi:hypothetical protein
MVEPLYLGRTATEARRGFGFEVGGGVVIHADPSVGHVRARRHDR